MIITQVNNFESLVGCVEPIETQAGKVIVTEVDIQSR
jgi:hypothetical protein